MAALVAALWAYDGWNDLNMVAGEIKQPERNIPIALIAGVATVGVLYVLMNAAVQYVLPAHAIAASPRPASDAIALVMGTHRREHRLGGHGDLDAGYIERHHHERRARPLRCGARRIFFLGSWQKCILAFTLLRLRSCCKRCCRSFCCCWEETSASFFRWPSSPNGSSI